jgi:predicted O-methyltransferase YrrM
MQGALADKCDYRLIEPEPDPMITLKSHELPENYKSADFNSHSFKAYVKAIDIYPDNYFDLVVIDGRARPSCIKHAVPKIKRGGVLVLDNSDRDYYLKNTRTFLEGWSQQTFRGTVRGLLHTEQTSIFRKP